MKRTTTYGLIGILCASSLSWGCGGNAEPDPSKSEAAAILVAKGYHRETSFAYKILGQRAEGDAFELIEEGQLDFPTPTCGGRNLPEFGPFRRLTEDQSCWSSASGATQDVDSPWPHQNAFYSVYVSHDERSGSYEHLYVSLSKHMSSDTAGEEARLSCSHTIDLENEQALESGNRSTCDGGADLQDFHQIQFEIEQLTP